jgi:hypothetical protein
MAQKPEEVGYTVYMNMLHLDKTQKIVVGVMILLAVVIGVVVLGGNTQKNTKVASNTSIGKVQDCMKGSYVMFYDNDTFWSELTNSSQGKALLQKENLTYCGIYTFTPARSGPISQTVYSFTGPHPDIPADATSGQIQTILYSFLSTDQKCEIAANDLNQTPLFNRQVQGVAKNYIIDGKFQSPYQNVNLYVNNFFKNKDLSGFLVTEDSFVKNDNVNKVPYMERHFDVYKKSSIPNIPVIDAKFFSTVTGWGQPLVYVFDPGIRFGLYSVTYGPDGNSPHGNEAEYATYPLRSECISYFESHPGLIK